MTANPEGKINMAHDDPTTAAQLRQEMIDDTKRYRRTYEATTQMMHLLRDFIPQNSECREALERHLMESLFRANAMIIAVRPEWDEMDKLRIEATIHDMKMAPTVKREIL